MNYLALIAIRCIALWFLLGGMTDLIMSLVFVASQDDWATVQPLVWLVSLVKVILALIVWGGSGWFASAMIGEAVNGPDFADLDYSILARLGFTLVGTAVVMDALPGLLVSLPGIFEGQGIESMEAVIAVALAGLLLLRLDWVVGKIIPKSKS